MCDNVCIEVNEVVENISFEVNNTIENVTVEIRDFSVFNIISEDAGNSATTGSDGLLFVPKIPAKTSDLINDGSYGTDTYVEYDELNVRLQLKQNLPTGFITGLQLSIVDSTTARIEIGAYIISNFSDLENITVQLKQVETPIDFTPAYLNTSAASYIALDVNMNVIQSSMPFTNEQRRTLCIIGAVIHSNLTSINLTNEIKAPIVEPTNQLHDFLKAVGFLNLSGNVFGANGSNLKLNKTSGVIWGLGINANDYLNPHQLSLPELTALQFKYRTRDISVVPESAYTTDLDVENYDFNGAITPIPNNKYTIQRINIFQSGEVRIQYGQNLYNTLDQAKAGVSLAPFINEQNISDNAIFRAYLVVKRETTDLSLAISNGTAEFLPVSKFGNIQGGGAVSLTLQAIIDALGYTPEDVANKAVDFTIVNDILYPTVQAVKTETDLKLPKDLSVLHAISLPLLDTDLAVLVRDGVAYKVDKSDLIIGNKRSMFLFFPINQNVAASTSWYALPSTGQVLAGTGYTANVSLTDANDFANQPILTPRHFVPFQHKVKSVSIHGRTNSTGATVNFAVQSAYENELTNTNLTVDNPLIVAQESFLLTRNPSGVNGFQYSVNIANIDTSTRNAFSDYRLYFNNGNVASNLFNCMLIVEVEEVL